MFDRKIPRGGVRAALFLIVSLCCATLPGAVGVSARECLDYELYGGRLGDAPLLGGLDLGADAVGVALQAGHAYLACRGDGLHIVELSHPEAPVRVAIADLLGNVACISVWGDYALAGVGSALKIVDVTAAAFPEWVQTVSVGGVVRDITLTPPLALIAAETAGLTVVDLTGSPYPAKLGAATTSAPARAVGGSATAAWLATDAGLEVFSLADPAHPTPVGAPLADTALGSLALDGANLWTATADGRLIVFDVSDPLVPTELRRHSLPSAAASLTIVDGFLYWSGADGLVRVAGVGSHGAYVPMGTLPIPGQAHAIGSFGPYLAIAAGSGGIQTGWRQCDLILAAGRDREPRARLLSNVPNPLNPGTTVIFSVSSPVRVLLTLHDARGRLVATLLDQFCEKGAHEVVWNGRLADGRRAPSGVWYVRLTAGEKIDAKSVVVLR